MRALLPLPARPDDPPHRPIYRRPSAATPPTILRRSVSVAVEEHENGREGQRQQHEAAAAGASRDPAWQARHGGKLTADRAITHTRPIIMFDANYFRTLLQRDVEKPSSLSTKL